MVRHIIADRNRLRRQEVGHQVDRTSYVFHNRDQGEINAEWKKVRLIEISEMINAAQYREIIST